MERGYRYSLPPLAATDAIIMKTMLAMENAITSGDPKPSVTITKRNAGSSNTSWKSWKLRDSVACLRSNSVFALFLMIKGANQSKRIGKTNQKSANAAISGVR